MHWLLAPKLKFSRDEFDTLRGFAMLAVVAHHVALWLDKGLAAQLADSSVMVELIQYQSTVLQPLRLPLFTILSGFIYAHRPVQSKTAIPFINGKFRRILIPLFFVSCVTYLKDVFIAGNVPSYKYEGVVYEVAAQDFWVLWFFHYKHLWFLQALMIIFGLVLLLDLLKQMNTLKSWLFWVAVFTALPYVFEGSSLWSTTKTAHLAVYFFIGLGFYRFRETFTKSRWLLPIAWLVFFAMMLLNIAWKLDIVELTDTRLMYVLAGASGSYCLLNLHLSLKWLAWIGGFSYTIYLYHGLGMETHLLFDNLLHHGSAGHLLWFVLTLGFGVIIPIGIHKVFEKIPLIRTPVLGKRLLNTK